MQLTAWKPVSVLPPRLALFGAHWISVLTPAKLPRFTFVWQPLYMELNLDNVLQHRLNFKLFICFVQPPICVMPGPAYTSVLNTHHQCKEVPSAPRFMLVKCNMSKTLLVKCNYMSKTLKFNCVSHVPCAFNFSSSAMMISGGIIRLVLYSLRPEKHVIVIRFLVVLFTWYLGYNGTDIGDAFDDLAATFQYHLMPYFLIPLDCVFIFDCLSVCVTNPLLLHYS